MITPLPDARSADAPSVSRVCRGLADKILEGGYAPGQKLPSTRAVARELGVHHLTVAEAYRRLGRRGLVVIKDRVGAFVRERTSKAGSVIITGAPMIEGSSFARITSRILTRLAVDGIPGDLKLVVREPGQLPILLQWIKDQAERGALRGAWLGNMNPEWVKAAHALLAEHAIPDVHISPRRILPRSVEMDMAGGVRQGTRYLAGLGCEHIALIAHSLETFPDWEEAFRASCEALGVRGRIESLPFNADLHYTTMERFGHEAIKTLLKARPRPGGVLITDDFLGRGVLPELLSRGARVARDLHVCTHSRKGDSFPGVFPLPVARLEVDVTLIADAAYDMLAAVASGQRVEQPHARVALRLVTPEEAEKEKQKAEIGQEALVP
ncbi:MAG TPA: GntR family transcriptional regulator [Candidatus Brocadiia bacterium]|nr:GntR family transcriptional regulator [Candidatus Brocadiia bacterium]